MDLRRLAIGFVTRAAALAVLLGIVIGSAVGLDEWADDLATHGSSATASLSSPAQPVIPPGT